MSGPISANLSFEEPRERFETAASSSTRRWASAERRGGLGVFLHLGCFAVVGALTASVFFGVAFSVLPHPIADASFTSGLRDRWGEAPLPSVLPSSAPVVLAGGAPAPRPTQSGATEPPGQPATLVATAADFAGPPEPGRVQVAENPRSKRLGNASAEIVSGFVTEVPDAMTWVVGSQVVHLWGIRPGTRTPLASLAGFVGRVSAEGPVTCRRQPHSNRYRCVSASRGDIAEMALLSGIGRAADGATVAYRGAEAQARANGRGAWAGR
jgi:hypothetical protein